MTVRYIWKVVATVSYLEKKAWHKDLHKIKFKMVHGERFLPAAQAAMECAAVRSKEEISESFGEKYEKMETEVKLLALVREDKVVDL